MKKKGFTLVELLAVIVILAVIAIIAVPIILNVIETSKQGAIKDSAYGVIESAEMYLAKNMKNGVETTMTFTCSNNKCVSDDIEISYKGKIESGTLLLTPSGKTVVCVDNGEYYAYKLEDEQKVTGGLGTCGEYVEANGEFTILSDIDSLRNEITSLRQQVIDSYNQGYQDADATDINNKEELWKITSNTSTQPSGTIQLSKSIADYRMIAIEYKAYYDETYYPTIPGTSTVYITVEDFRNSIKHYHYPMVALGSGTTTSHNSSGWADWYRYVYYVSDTEISHVTYSESVCVIKAIYGIK